MKYKSSGVDVGVLRMVDFYDLFYLFIFFFFKQKTAYEIGQWLEFRRVLFRSMIIQITIKDTGPTIEICIGEKFTIRTPRNSLNRSIINLI